MTKKNLQERFDNKLNSKVKQVLFKNKITSFKQVDIINFNKFTKIFDEISKENPNFFEAMEQVRQTASMCEIACQLNKQKFIKNDKNAVSPTLYAYACTQVLRSTIIDKINKFYDDTRIVDNRTIVSPHISNVLKCLNSTITSVSIDNNNSLEVLEK